MKKMLYAVLFLLFVVPLVTFADENKMNSLEIKDFIKDKNLDNAYTYKIEYPNDIKETITNYQLSGKNNKLKLVTEVVLSNDTIFTFYSNISSVDDIYSFKIDSSQLVGNTSIKIRAHVEDFSGEKHYTDWSDYYFYSYTTQRRIFLNSIADHLVSKSSMQNTTLIANHENIKIQLASIGIALSCLTMLFLVLCLRKSN